MRILILGGDGYLGWPLALYLSTKGHEVAIFDNLVRRQITLRYDLNSLLPIASLPQRVGTWETLSGARLPLFFGDVRRYDDLVESLTLFDPQVIIHAAHIGSAPLSMLNREQAIAMQVATIEGSMTLLYALKALLPQCHLIRLASSGEDCLDGSVEQPASFAEVSQHTVSQNLHLAARLWHLRVTEVQIGIVYGVSTPETRMDPRLAIRYDYDQIFGTVLHRFCAQAVCNHPLSVYGDGEQVRRFLALSDLLVALDSLVRHPPSEVGVGALRLPSEACSINELAERVQTQARLMGFAPEIQHLPSPRVEARVSAQLAQRHNQQEVVPSRLMQEDIARLLQQASSHRSRINYETFAPTVQWRVTSNEVFGHHAKGDMCLERRW